MYKVSLQHLNFYQVITNRRTDAFNRISTHPDKFLYVVYNSVYCLNFRAVFDFLRKLAAEMKRSYLQYGLFRSFYNIITAEDAELVMNDQKNLIHKGVIYNFFVPFLNRGLLTSSGTAFIWKFVIWSKYLFNSTNGLGKKWYSRRKMLTPAFHFKILTQFEEIFKWAFLSVNIL